MDENQIQISARGPVQYQQIGIGLQGAPKSKLLLHSQHLYASSRYRALGSSVEQISLSRLLV